MGDLITDCEGTQMRVGSRVKAVLGAYKGLMGRVSGPHADGVLGVARDLVEVTTDEGCRRWVEPGCLRVTEF